MRQQTWHLNPSWQLCQGNPKMQIPLRGHGILVPRRIFKMARGDELCGVIVYSYPPPACYERRLGFLFFFLLRKNPGAPANLKKVVTMKTDSSSCLPDTQRWQQVGLLANMYFQIKICGVTIVLAALEPTACSSIVGFKDTELVNQLSRRCPSCDKDLKVLTSLMAWD